MPRPKLTEEGVVEREKRAEEMKTFLKNNLMTEAKLAEILGISRRTVQMVKSGRVSPQPATLRAWNNLVSKYKRNQSITF